MEVSQATIQTIYTLRLTPIIQNVFKKKNWTVGKKDFQRILSLTFENFSKFQPDTFIGLTDEDLIYELYNQFESGPLADFLFSIECLQVRRSNYDIRHKETLRLFLREYFELFEERMFHCFCGIYFQYRKLVFPIAMFTDTAKWEKPIPD
ncbi:hypothetical protein MHK_007104, partial [Candidatus Magnetomorum sp. HK-1]